MKRPKHNEDSRQHAMAMRAWHQDGMRFGAACILTFAGAALINGGLWVFTGAGVSGAGALIALAGVIFGVWQHIHHGKRSAKWENALAVIDAARRDRFILHHVTRRDQY